MIRDRAVTLAKRKKGKRGEIQRQGRMMALFMEGFPKR